MFENLASPESNPEFIYCNILIIYEFSGIKHFLNVHIDLTIFFPERRHRYKKN